MICKDCKEEVKDHWSECCLPCFYAERTPYRVGKYLIWLRTDYINHQPWGTYHIGLVEDCYFNKDAYTIQFFADEKPFIQPRLEKLLSKLKTKAKVLIAEPDFERKLLAMKMK